MCQIQYFEKEKKRENAFLLCSIFLHWHADHLGIIHIWIWVLFPFGFRHVDI